MRLFQTCKTDSVCGRYAGQENCQHYIWLSKQGAGNETKANTNSYEQEDNKDNWITIVCMYVCTIYANVYFNIN